jgi:hypothetical protein
MNKILKLAICTGIISPFCASAQLVTINEPSDNTDFNDLVALMADDGAALYTGPGEANAGPFSKVHWDDSTEKWVVGSFGLDEFDLNFELQMVNADYFYMIGNEINIGFVANENWNVDELFVTASKTGYSDRRERLFEYSDVVATNNEAGDTAQLINPEVDLPIRLQFEHINKTLSPLGSIYQSNELRFSIFRQVNVDDQGDVASDGKDWLFRIDDDNSYDDDTDDGFFYVTGDISPVPEPSQIAALSLLGLGALLIVRRRLVKRNK